MDPKKYTSFREIDEDLKRLQLERQIAVEELKGIQHSITEELRPYHWVSWLVKLGQKYGILLLLRKVFK